MTTGQLVSLDEYMHTSYEYDAEFVEGRIIYRTMPQRPHSQMQSFLDRTLYAVGKPLGYRVWPEQRVQTQSDHCRVPDLCVTKGDPNENVFKTPPFLCIEILSPDDPPGEVRAKVDEYLAFGVPFIWVVDPVRLRGEIHTKTGVERVDDGIFKAGEIAVNVQHLD